MSQVVIGGRGGFGFALDSGAVDVLLVTGHHDGNPVDAQRLAFICRAAKLGYGDELIRGR